MARSEPLIQEADPHITKFALGALMSDKMIQKKGVCGFFLSVKFATSLLALLAGGLKQLDNL